MRLSSSIPVFLINLDRSPERLASFENQVEELGLTFERVTAVDRCDISEEEVKRLQKNSSQLFPWDKGAMGCFLSHRKVWQIIVKRELDWAFIAEDDLHIAKVKPFYVNKNWIPHDANIVKAETFRCRVSLAQRSGAEVDGHDLRKLQSSHIGGGGYFINTHAAQLLLKETQRVCDPVDHIIFDPLCGIFQQMSVYQIDPAICVQDFLLQDARHKVGFRSTLQGERRGWDGSKISPKPKGWAKVRREITRPFKRLGERIWRSWLNMRQGTTFKVVPYVEDRRWYQSNRK